MLGSCSLGLQPSAGRTGIKEPLVTRYGPRRWLAILSLLVLFIGGATGSDGSLQAAPAPEDGLFYHLSLNEVDWVDETFPPANPGNRRALWQLRGPVIPYVLLDQAGEAYLGFSQANGNLVRGRGFDTPQGLSVLVTTDTPVTGTVFWPRQDSQSMDRFDFRLKPTQASVIASTDFYRDKARHYRLLQGRNLPGTAWFRHQARQAEERAGMANPDATASPATNQRGSDTQLESTFSLFTGGQAISENLQLDRLLNVSG